jgi:DHA1 family inner membrane transport protein
VAAGLGYTSPLWAGALVTLVGLAVLVAATLAPGGEFARRPEGERPAVAAE